MRCLPWAPPALLLTSLLVLPSSAVPAAAPSCDGRTATIVGSEGRDRITGTDRADVIAGLGGDDLIDGLRGDDLVCGGPGADRLLGGRGDDDLYGGLDKRADGPAGTYLLGDVLTGGPGDDLLVGGIDRRRADTRRRPDTFSYADARTRVVVDLSGTAANGTATGRGSDTLVLGLTHGVIGSPKNDRITGSRFRDRIDGGAGDDRIDAGAGSDLLYPDGLGGSDGSDVVTAGPGNDLVNSRTGRDRISTGKGGDFVEAFSEQPTSVELGLGDDYLGQLVTPGRGASSVGGLGDDVVAFYARQIAGQKPAARFTVDRQAGTTYASGAVEARGTIGGFEGHRLVGPVRWTFLGGPSADRVWAITGGPLTARTADGPDQLRGTDLADLLDGGKGTDTGYGEGGKDTCTSVERGDC